MKMKKIFAAMAATAVSAVSLAAMSLTSYAATEIPYTGPTAGALATDNDGVSLRLNIYNTWGNDFRDIDENTAVIDYVKVNFTISGIGDNDRNHNEDGSDGDAYVAFLAGGIVTNPRVWEADKDGSAGTAISGDGTYECTWTLAEDSESISCLILQTNINYFNFGSSIEESGIDIKINSITTGSEDGSEDTTAAPTDAPASDAQTTTAASGNNGETATTTAAPVAGDSKSTTAAPKAGDSKSTTTTKAPANGGKTEASTNTGDAGVGVAAAAIVLAGTAAFAARKRK